MKRHVTTLFALAALVSGAIWAAPSSTSRVITEGPSWAERAAIQTQRYEMLTVRAVPQGLAHPHTVRVSSADLAEMRRGQETERRLRVGLVEPVGLELSLSGAVNLGTRTMNLDFGAIRGASTAGFDWSGAIDSPGATALRLHFTGFFLPKNVELYLYGASGQVAGPYTRRGPWGTGEFWSTTVYGDSISLHLVYEGSDLGRVLRATSFVVDDLGYIGEGFHVVAPPDRQATCTYNDQRCVNNGTSGAPGVTSDAQDGVAHILFPSGRYYYICSGGLVAALDGSQTPYFLTAHHCISKGNEANNMDAFFHFTTGCNGPDYNAPDTSGATILSTSRTSDYTLMQLAETPPSGTTLIGYDANSIAYSNGATLHRISHPQGAPQTYSQHAVDTSKGTCQSWPRGNWIYSRDVVGATEGGSSGSPVLNAAGQIVGQLSGGCGTNVNDTCDSVNNATVDGHLNAYFSSVASWLDPSGGPSCTSGPEICDDGCDNDGDGLVDGADPDCGGGGGCDLLPPGSSCTSDNQCCSNKCKGKPGSKTCN